MSNYANTSEGNAVSKPAGSVTVTNASKLPFEHFLLVRLPLATRIPVAEEHLSVPKARPLTETVLSFCFPNAKVIQPQVARDEYTFALTASDGARQYGYCYIFPAHPDAENIYCLSILSYFHWAGFFQQAVRWLATCWEARPKCHHVLLEHMLRCGVPRGGQVPTLPPASALSSLGRPLRPAGADCIPPAIRPRRGAPLLHDRVAHALLTALDSEKLMYMFSTLLCERRIVFTSNNLNFLSQCIHAAEAILWPFRWQQVFIPLLPESMLNYCAAPMPFLIGLPSSSLQILEHLPLEKMVIVNLDEHRTGAFAEDVDLVPARLLNKLKQRLDQCASSAAAPAVALCFREFFLALLQGYDGFIRSHRQRRGLRFDSAAFIASQPADVRSFLTAFCESQMFERWIADREREHDAGAPPKDLFHRELAAYVDDSASYQSYSEKLSNATSRLFGSMMSKYKKAREKYGQPQTQSMSQLPSHQQQQQQQKRAFSGRTARTRGGRPAPAHNGSHSMHQRTISAPTAIRNHPPPGGPPSRFQGRHAANAARHSATSHAKTPPPGPPDSSRRAGNTVPYDTQGGSKSRRAAGLKTKGDVLRYRRVDVDCSRQDAAMQDAVQDPVHQLSFPIVHASLAPDRPVSDNVFFVGDAPSTHARYAKLAHREARRKQNQTALAERFHETVGGRVDQRVNSHGQSSRRATTGGGGSDFQGRTRGTSVPAGYNVARSGNASGLPKSNVSVPSTGRPPLPPHRQGTGPSSYQSTAVSKSTTVAAGAAATRQQVSARSTMGPSANTGSTSPLVVLKQPQVVHVVSSSNDGNDSMKARSSQPIGIPPGQSVQGGENQGPHASSKSGGFLFTPPDTNMASYAPPPPTGIHALQTPTSVMIPTASTMRAAVPPYEGNHHGQSTPSSHHHPSSTSSLL